MQALHAQIS